MLNVEYRDTDQVILPITEMISEVYQAYSTAAAPALSNLITYLNEQINKIKPQAEASARAALDYGYSNGLGMRDGLPLAGNVAGAGVSEDSRATVSSAGGSVEAARTAAQQKIKSLEVQIQ